MSRSIPLKWRPRIVCAAFVYLALLIVACAALPLRDGDGFGLFLFGVLGPCLVVVVASLLRDVLRWMRGADEPAGEA